MLATKPSTLLRRAIPCWERESRGFTERIDVIKYVASSRKKALVWKGNRGVSESVSMRAAREQYLIVVLFVAVTVHERILGLVVLLINIDVKGTGNEYVQNK